MTFPTFRPVAVSNFCSRIMLFAAAIVMMSAPSAWALIMGGEGNEPRRDPGWPKGAAAVFNSETRVAWWEGPPFGGGQWHAECRGDAAALSLVLDDFSKVEIPKKRIVLHDGFGSSFWLNTNREKEKQANALIDWTFMVWQPDRLKFQQDLPAGFRAVEKGEPVLAQLDVYTGGFVRWADVIVPKGFEIIDERLEAHGFKVSDGTVLEGKVIDLATKKPLVATLTLEEIQPQKTGGYHYEKLTAVATDAEGRWVVKNAPTAWCRLVLSAEGYVSRVIGFGQYDDKPRWAEHNSGLSKSAPVSGRVVDPTGKPLADVEVRIGDLDAKNGGRYETVDGSKVMTDAEGRFRVDTVPLGTASVWVHKPGYVRPGLGPNIETPATDLKLEMQPAATLKVRVDFTATTRPEGYIINMKPEGGEKIGSWGGSANINAEGQHTFQNIPPGKYILTGRPNPGSDNQETAPETVDLKGGKTTELTIKAK